MFYNNKMELILELFGAFLERSTGTTLLWLLLVELERGEQSGQGRLGCGARLLLLLQFAHSGASLRTCCALRGHAGLG